MAAEPVVATYSIVACDLEAGQWGVAVQSKFLAVGSVVPWAEPGVGAIATQSYANPRYGPDGLALLRDGSSADETLEALTSADKDRDQRQAGIVDGQGRAATFTGSGCHDWAGGRTGDGHAAQGNISDSVVDLRVDDHAHPIAELLRIFGLHRELFGVTPPEDWVDVDETLAGELRDRLAKLGFEGELAHAFDDWAGNANLEERVDGVERIDPIVLAALRKQSA